MSTSYSGTVLGIDLDLGFPFEFVRPGSKSRPLTPVTLPWLTPQMAELERQASLQESPELKRTSRPHVTHCSITSSALTSLLPIAAASGIVRPNYNTPKISFFSPSGNLIQPGGKSTPRTSISDLCASPVNASAQHSSRAKLRGSPASERVYLPPVRPALVPMTNPPFLTAQLPAHLKFHHNYRQPEKSYIDLTDSFIVPAPEVKGCGGMVKSPSFALQNGLRDIPKVVQVHPHRKRHRSMRSLAGDMKFEAKFYRARLVAAASVSCRSHRMRERFAMEPTRDVCTGHVPGHINSSKERLAEEILMNGDSDEDPQSRTNHNKTAFGHLTGHALRICFCQPFDGAGKPTRAVVAGIPCMNMQACAASSPDRVNKIHATTREVDGDLPNSRVVGGRSGQKVKKHGTYKASKHNRTRNDSAVSVGVGLRVATIGG